MATFFELNGFRLTATEPEDVTVMLAVASGEMSEPKLTDWLREHCKRVRRGTKA